jgi:replicative DNA helicase
MLKDKVPPHNEEAEQAVLGAMLLDNESIDTVIQYIRADDFYSNANRRVFGAVLNLYNQGRQKADIITVVAELRQAGELDGSGGPAYVASLTNVVPSSANADYYAKIVQDCSLRRSLLRISAEITSLSCDESCEARQILEETQEKFFCLAEDRQAVSYKSAKELVREALEMLDKLRASKGAYTGVPSGFGELDDLTSGFQGSELVIIGARPSIGKTALALNMAAHSAVKEKRPTAFFSLEMSDMALLFRLISSEANVEMQKMRSGIYLSSDYPRILNACDKLFEAPLYIEDTPGLKMRDLRSQARRLRSQQKVEIIFIDYISLITWENSKIPRYEQISEISRSLKSLARELDIPIVALSQLRRDAEGNRPGLADIRESGSIEQDADLVIFLHREREWELSEKKDPEKKNTAELILAKQRNGPVGYLQLHFEPRFAKFTPLDRTRQ